MFNKISDESKTLKNFQKKEMRKTFSHIGLCLFAYDVFIKILIVASVLLLDYLLLYSFSTADYTHFQWIITFVCQDVFGFGLIVVLMRLKPAKHVVIERKKINLQTAVILAIASMAVMEIGSVISTVFTSLIEKITNTTLTNSVSNLIDGSSMIVVFLMVVVIGPVIEEIIYRKMVLDRIRIYGEKFAVIVSAVLFALAHGNFFQLFYSFGFGCILGYLYLKTNNIKISIGYHMFINFTGSIVPMAVLRLGQTAMAVYVLFTFAVMLAGIYMLTILWKNLYFEKSRLLRLNTCEKVISSFINTGIILFLISCAFNFSV